LLALVAHLAMTASSSFGPRHTLELSAGLQIIRRGSIRSATCTLLASFIPRSLSRLPLLCRPLSGNFFLGTFHPKLFASSLSSRNGIKQIRGIIARFLGQVESLSAVIFFVLNRRGLSVGRQRPHHSAASRRLAASTARRGCAHDGGPHPPLPPDSSCVEPESGSSCRCCSRAGLRTCVRDDPLPPPASRWGLWRDHVGGLEGEAMAMEEQARYGIYAKKLDPY
jgi:hypothetical protein